MQTSPGTDPDQPTTPRVVRWGRRGVRAAAYAIPGARVLLALKTALAVSLAWVVAQRMPGVVAEYPYYAPLGAISAMYPTVMGSVRTGLQTVAGLALGILLATGVLLVGSPNLVTVGLAVGIGTLLAGLRRLGAGAEYVPMAALFVLIVGGPDAEDYSIGYLVQMAVGVAIGLLVNVLVIPPLDFRTARLQLDRLQGVVADYLGDVARELESPGTTAGRDWDLRSQELSRLTAEVREAVEESAQSARGNPRVVLRRAAGRTDPGYEPLKKLEQVVFHVRALADALRQIYDHETHRWTAAEPLTRRLAATVEDARACVQAWSDDEDVAEPAARVREALGTLYARPVDPADAEHRLVIAAAAELGRVIDVLDPQQQPRGSSRVTKQD